MSARKLNIFPLEKSHQLLRSWSFLPSIKSRNASAVVTSHTPLSLVGYSAAAKATSFVIPEMSIGLDMGVHIPGYTGKCQHFFITHGHLDHIISFPDAFLFETAGALNDFLPTLYCSKLMQKKLNNICMAFCDLNSTKEKIISWKIKSINPGQTIKLSSSYSVQPYLCHHNVETYGYAFFETLTKIKPEYKIHMRLSPCIFEVLNLCCLPLTIKMHCQQRFQELEYDVDELRKLSDEEFCRKLISEVGIPHETCQKFFRKMNKPTLPFELMQNHETVNKIRIPLFCYNGDTSPSVFWNKKFNFDFPVIITECTFFLPHHRKRARLTKHTHWADLESIIRNRPSTTFILIHFTISCSLDQILDFFNLPGMPENIMVWLNNEQSTYVQERYQKEESSSPWSVNSLSKLSKTYDTSNLRTKNSSSMLHN